MGTWFQADARLQLADGAQSTPTAAPSILMLYASWLTFLPQWTLGSRQQASVEQVICFLEIQISLLPASGPITMAMEGTAALPSDM